MSEREETGVSTHTSHGGCPDCGHALMEHGASGCTHGLHRRDPDDRAAGYEVCPCRRGRQDPLPDEED